MCKTCFVCGIAENRTVRAPSRVYWWNESKEPKLEPVMLEPVMFLQDSPLVCQVCRRGTGEHKYNRIHPDRRQTATEKYYAGFCRGTRTIPGFVSDVQAKPKPVRKTTGRRVPLTVAPADPLRKRLLRNLLKYACGQSICCPQCGDILDTRKAVLFKHPAIALCRVCADASLDRFRDASAGRFTETELLSRFASNVECDGQALFAK